MSDDKKTIRDVKALGSLVGRQATKIINKQKLKTGLGGVPQLRIGARVPESLYSKLKPGQKEPVFVPITDPNDGRIFSHKERYLEQSLPKKLRGPSWKDTEHPKEMPGMIDGPMLKQPRDKDYWRGVPLTHPQPPAWLRKQGAALSKVAYTAYERTLDRKFGSKAYVSKQQKRLSSFSPPASALASQQEKKSILRRPGMAGVTRGGSYLNILKTAMLKKVARGPSQSIPYVPPSMGHAIPKNKTVSRAMKSMKPAVESAAHSAFPRTFDPNNPRNRKGKKGIGFGAPPSMAGVTRGGSYLNILKTAGSVAVTPSTTPSYKPPKPLKPHPNLNRNIALAAMMQPKPKIAPVSALRVKPSLRPSSAGVTRGGSYLDVLKSASVSPVISELYALYKTASVPVGTRNVASPPTGITVKPKLTAFSDPRLLKPARAKARITISRPTGYNFMGIKKTVGVRAPSAFKPVSTARPSSAGVTRGGSYLDVLKTAMPEPMFAPTTPSATTSSVTTSFKPVRTAVSAVPHVTGLRGSKTKIKPLAKRVAGSTQAYMSSGRRIIGNVTSSKASPPAGASPLSAPASGQNRGGSYLNILKTAGGPSFIPTGTKTYSPRWPGDPGPAAIANTTKWMDKMTKDQVRDQLAGNKPVWAPTDTAMKYYKPRLIAENKAKNIDMKGNPLPVTRRPSAAGVTRGGSYLSILKTSGILKKAQGGHPGTVYASSWGSVKQNPKTKKFAPVKSHWANRGGYPTNPNKALIKGQLGQRFAAKPAMAGVTRGGSYLNILKTAGIPGVQSTSGARKGPAGRTVTITPAPIGHSSLPIPGASKMDKLNLAAKGIKPAKAGVARGGSYLNILKTSAAIYEKKAHLAGLLQERLR